MFAHRAIERLSDAGKYLTPILVPFIFIMLLAILGMVALAEHNERRAVESRNQRSAMALDRALEVIAQDAEERSLRHDDADRARTQLILDELNALRKELYLIHVAQHNAEGKPRPDNPVPTQAPRAPGKSRVGVTPRPEVAEESGSQPNNESGTAPRPPSSGASNNCLISLFGFCLIR